MKNTNKHIKSVLGLDATVKDVKQLLNDNQISEVVVLDNTHYMGLLRYEYVEFLEPNTQLSDITHIIKSIYLEEGYTLFDWLKIKSIGEFNHIPLISPVDRAYLGSLSEAEIVQNLSETGLLVDFSSIILLRKDTKDFKYSEVFQIAEANGAKIFGSYIEKTTQEDTFIVLNAMHSGLNELLQSFRRYDYDIVSYHEEDRHNDTLKANSEYFSKYLTV